MDSGRLFKLDLDATTVAEAENEFTDEAPRLFSRLPSAINTIIATGE